MKYIVVSIAFFCFLSTMNAQQNQENKRVKVTLGLEQDVLPYILKGYIGTAWIGREMSRIRFSYAEADAPSFVLDETIQSDRVNAFGISYEYFFKENFKGIWFGPGIGVWTNNVTSKNQQSIKHQSFVFSLGSGYNYFLGKRVYLSPWLALHARVSGNGNIPVGNTIYKPMTLTPELSIKVGIKLF